jgi:hypothetical protein
MVASFTTFHSHLYGTDREMGEQEEILSTQSMLLITFLSKFRIEEKANL